MRSERGLPGGGGSRSLGRWLAVGIAAAAFLVLVPAAFAIKPAEKEEFLVFDHCPLTLAVACVVSHTTSGEFVIGTNKSAVPISKPVLIQGGLAGTPDLAPEPLIAAVGAESFQKVPQEVPGGLTGLPLSGGSLAEVNATAELAGPVSSVVLNAWALLNKNPSPAVTLPIKVHLQNELLGEDCYIGSDAEPIVLHLTTGTTKPPEGTEPIKGGWEALEYPAKGDILRIKGVKLVDNDFAVPGATGCGPEPLTALVDEAIDLKIGLPAAAGASTAILAGTSEQSEAQYVKKYTPIEKERKEKEKKEQKEQKEKEKKEKQEGK